MRTINRVAVGFAFVIGMLLLLPQLYAAEAYGPYISDPEVVTALDCPDDACDGPLNFVKLIRHQFRSAAALLRPGMNPFNLPEAHQIVATISADLQEIRLGVPNPQLSLSFLTDPGSRVELVGVINRMDRQFLREHAESNCGEISAIYRFSYSIREGKQESRLPVTMNIVFPAAGESVDCKTVAQRWLNAIQQSGDRTPEQIAKDLVDPASGPLAYLTGGKINRLELNMQAYRIPAALDPNNFGSEATYLIRVFRWNKDDQLFEPVELPNQIDRKAVLCEPSDSVALCNFKNANRHKLVEYLQRPDVVAKIDNGTLEIPSNLGVLSRRAVSISPGGRHRSANQPYWNSTQPEQQVISDAEIDSAIGRAKGAGIQLNYIESADDFRTRLNDSTCTGCHQTRAIAGFHFPGADRAKTTPANAVLLAGSPHFYGEQPRRLKIVSLISQDEDGALPDNELTMNYSARPLSQYEDALKDTQLIGGWGGTCLIPKFSLHSKRNWECRSGLQCKQVFASNNDPGAGICVPPAGGMEIGDSLQQGTVTSAAFGYDVYQRTDPTPVKDDTRIPGSALPSHAPEGNSYYGAHQEFYEGIDPNNAPECKNDPPDPACYNIRRDRSTGGFPAGTLRLLECVGLPNEATCGLIASSGFNSCISRIGKEDYDVNICFSYFTSFGGLRACDHANPCRDDYICAKPMNYTPSTYDDRLYHLKKDPYFERINGRKYDEKDDGQKRPDDMWVARNDKRGLCIPPYFVFQFRSDGHPSPSTQ